MQKPEHQLDVRDLNDSEIQGNGLQTMEDSCSRWGQGIKSHYYHNPKHYHGSKNGRSNY